MYNKKKSHTPIIKQWMYLKNYSTEGVRSFLHVLTHPYHRTNTAFPNTTAGD